MILVAALLAAAVNADTMEYRCGDERVSAPADCKPNTLCEYWGDRGWAPCSIQPSKTNSPAPLPSEAEQCRASLKCWAERWKIYALGDCEGQIEGRAKHQSRWETGWFEPKFDHYGWLDEKAGTVVYYGDKISMQNGFGAWNKMKYACMFDPASKSVIEVVVSER